VVKTSSPPGPNLHALRALDGHPDFGRVGAGRDREYFLDIIAMRPEQEADPGINLAQTDRLKSCQPRTPPAGRADVRGDFRPGRLQRRRLGRRGFRRTLDQRAKLRRSAGSGAAQFRQGIVDRTVLPDMHRSAEGPRIERHAFIRDLPLVGNKRNLNSGGVFQQVGRFRIRRFRVRPAVGPSA
jgi:hypothetical protein